MMKIKNFNRDNTSATSDRRPDDSGKWEPFCNNGSVIDGTWHRMVMETFALMSVPVNTANPQERER